MSTEVQLLPLEASPSEAETAHASTEYQGLDLKNKQSEDTAETADGSVQLPPLRSNPVPTSADDSPPKMTYSSSPVSYPPSSSPVPVQKKRKLFQTLHLSPRKRLRLDEDTQIRDVGLQAHKVPETAILGSVNGVQDKGFTTNGFVEDIDDVLGLSYGSSSKSANIPPISLSAVEAKSRHWIYAKTATGTQLNIRTRTRQDAISFERTVAQRSVTAEGRAKTAYYGIDIHNLIKEAETESELKSLQKEVVKEPEAQESLQMSVNAPKGRPKQLWTEKYRPKRFTDLIGDERTHRDVLKWLRSWDKTVFPGNVKNKPKKIFEGRESASDSQQRKVLLLTGPPGLGKTTLAHVCAKHAGYEVLEINASDDRSREVVRGRIKDALGTENVRGINEQGHGRRAGRPICVIVDEVDGVVAGSSSGGGEGGFMKALIDLTQLDQKNSSGTNSRYTKGRKGDNFRQLRPLILICNDAYAASLRPLRTSSIAEVVHVKRPALSKVMIRIKDVFEKEKVPCDNDAVRRLCESSWGLGTRKQNSLGGRGGGEGDIRGILVSGEWVAHKFHATSKSRTETRLTRKWMEQHLGETQASSGHKGLGRGGVREVVDRIFVEGAGLPNLPTTLSADDRRLVSESKTNPIGVANLRKRAAINTLREMVDTCGEHDRLMTDCFATYPTLTYQDDANLSKPNAGYEWLNFHDSLSRRIFGGQEWELNPYLSSSACGFHHLFAAVDKGDKSWSDEQVKENPDEADVHPFAGPRADFVAYEAEKEHRTTLTEIQNSFPAPLLRLFRSLDIVATELVPNLSKMTAPEVKPVVIGGRSGLASVASVRRETEKRCVDRAVQVMESLKISLEKVKVEVEGGGAHANTGFAYRMEP